MKFLYFFFRSFKMLLCIFSVCFFYQTISQERLCTEDEIAIGQTGHCKTAADPVCSGGQQIQGRCDPVSHCEQRVEDDGLEIFFAKTSCSCEEYKDYGSLDGEGQRELDDNISICMEAARKAKALASVGESCDSVVSCCEIKREAFKIFWPDDKQCECNKLESLIGMEASHLYSGRVFHAAERLNSCVEKAAEAAKHKCVSKCKTYINASMQGCESSKPKEGFCNQQCELNNTVPPNESFTLLQNIEGKNSSHREHCISETKKSFISEYKNECKNILQDIQKERDRKLIVNNNNINENLENYCEEKATKAYGGSPKSNDVLTEVWRFLKFNM